MFTKRTIPLAFAVTVLTAGTASAQNRPTGRPGGNNFVAPKPFVPPTTFVQPKPFVAPKPFIAHKPIVVQPQFVAKPTFAQQTFATQKSFFVPPLGHHHHGHHHHHHGHHHHGFFPPFYTPPFWGGLWGFPVKTVPVYVYPLPGFWFGW